MQLQIRMSADILDSISRWHDYAVVSFICIIFRFRFCRTFLRQWTFDGFLCYWEIDSDRCMHIAHKVRVGNKHPSISSVQRSSPRLGTWASALPFYSSTISLSLSPRVAVFLRTMWSWSAPQIKSILLEGLMQTFLWTSVWDDWLNVANCQQLHLGSGHKRLIFMLNETGESFPPE